MESGGIKARMKGIKRVVAVQQQKQKSLIAFGYEKK